MLDTQPIVVSPETAQEAADLLENVSNEEMKQGDIDQHGEIDEEKRSGILNEIMRREKDFWLAGIAIDYKVSLEQVQAIYEERNRRLGR